MNTCLVLLTLPLLLSPVLCCGQLKVVDATEIMDKIKKGEPVLYQNREIAGVLDFTKLADRLQQKDNTNGHETNVSLVQVSLKFINCTFKGDVVAFYQQDKEGKMTARADFKEEVIFLNCRFENVVSFWRSQFAKVISFQQCQFSGKVLFRHSYFSDQADFSSATFREETDFGHTRFSKITSFQKSKFEDKADFRHTRFPGGVSFEQASFNQYADFRHTRIDNTVQFTKTSFKGRYDFDHTRFNGQSFVPVSNNE